jgi:hypothetical protein
MKFKIEIDMSNAAFDAYPLNEVAKIVQVQVYELIRSGEQREWKELLRDTNGNIVGWAYTEE